MVPAGRVNISHLNGSGILTYRLIFSFHYFLSMKKAIESEVPEKN